MKREIKFRGKSVTDGRWIYGSLIITNNLYEITDDSTFSKWREEVDEETVDQYSGLVDSHRNEIYESDILTFPISVDSKEDYFFCRFTNGGFNFFTKSGLIKNVDTTIYTVVGNIHEHSDLLK